MYIYICVCVCVCGAIGKLSSKLRKNSNNADISFYQVYLPNLHDKILKYYRLNLLKEIAISFNHGLQMSSESPQAFPIFSLFKLVNSAIILAFSSSHGVAWIFIDLSLNHMTHIIINGIAIWGVRQPDVRNDVVEEILIQPRLGSPACVA